MFWGSFGLSLRHNPSDTPFYGQDCSHLPGSAQGVPIPNGETAWDPKYLNIGYRLPDMSVAI